MATATDTNALPTLEALLFAAPVPLTAERLAELLEVSLGEVGRLITRLGEEYHDRGIQVVQVGGGYRMATQPQYAELVAQLRPELKVRLSRPAMETLAVVAYRQAVTRAEIESIRGVDSSATLQTLIEHELCELAGRREAPGRPWLYRTTPLFLERFGLQSLTELPPLEQFADLLPPEFSAEPSLEELGALEIGPSAEEEREHSDNG